ncbi:murein transglycosylase A [Stakelama tenebrarum]|uniref:peptidoglycan lytic exotransglycosylase n=1 Tax=Stakelama tenebrarum TaxID=2711215 RepID=A0A6G6Y3T3_9SPHN|nr:murein transglycosylase A [Sphingosinithalassobacter tenebrarum]QIG79575.1 murein transglycosylase A [Sphingosinithalassobacter tenebrarum]
MRAWGVAALALLLGACSGSLVPPATEYGSAPYGGSPGGTVNEVPVRQPTPATPIPPVPAAPAPPSADIAAGSGIVGGPDFATLPITDDAAARALAAYRTSCGSTARRTDQSGLTRPEDWAVSCQAAQNWPVTDARNFFARYFETVQIADGSAFATGYYEPEIAGSRTRRSGYDVPIYGKPADLVDVDLGDFAEDLEGRKIRGRVQGTDFVPYYDRTEIEQGALAGRGLEIAWAHDPVELFFLQVQGSGRLRLPDGGVMRIGYAGQNGRSYTGIGGLMRDRGLLAPGQANMQGIMQWLRDHPAEGRAIMRENKSWVFFRELTGPGPLGAMGYAVTGRTSAAADPKFVPMGAPVFLSMDRADATGLWVIQDTGGAIKGANRFDTFWGAGAEARAIAGGMSAHGTAFLLLPVGTLARHGAR